jgi:hypothetical protein
LDRSEGLVMEHQTEARIRVFIAAPTAGAIGNLRTPDLAGDFCGREEIHKVHDLRT